MRDFFLLKKFDRSHRYALTFFVEKISALFVSVLAPNAKFGLKEAEVKKLLVESGLEDLKFKILTHSKRNGRFDFQELIDRYELSNYSLILLNGDNEWLLKNILKEINTKPLMDILNINNEKVKVINASA